MTCELTPQPKPQTFAIFRSLAVSFALAASVIGLAAYTIPTVWWSGTREGPNVSRWTGAIPTSNPWTKEMVVLHTTGDLVTWLAFLTIARSYYLYHPRIASGASENAVRCITVVFVACATLHLMGAYTNFYPIYLLMGWVKLVGGFISIAGAIFLTAAMFKTAAIWENQRLFLDAAEKRQNDASEVSKVLNSHRYAIVDLTKQKEDSEKQDS